MIYFSLKRNLALLPFAAMTFLACPDQSFAMKRPLDGERASDRPSKREKNAMASEANVPAFTLADVNELIAKAKENHTEAQDLLMDICYRGLFLNVLTPDNICFFSWNEGKIEEIVCQNDLYAYFVLNRYKNFGNPLPEKIINLLNALRQATQNRADEQIAQAQFNLAFMYEGLGGLPKDEREAVRLYTLAADQGHASAQYYLGFMYQNGLGGLDKNEGEAVRLYTLAANQGHADAQCKLGLMYQYGLDGLVKNDEEAVRLYTLSAIQGHAQAQCKLANMHFYGLCGLPKDEREAARLLTLAADQGHPTAQFNLGCMYQNGVGVEKNLVEALRWWIKAKTPNAKESFFSVLPLQQFHVGEGNHSSEVLLNEIIEDLGTFVCTYQIKKEENDPNGFNTFFIPQLYTKHEKVEEIAGGLLGYIQCLKPGCLMTEFIVPAGLKNSLAQQIQPHFLSIDDIEGITYVTIGERNVHVAKKLADCLNKVSEVDEALASISQLYQKGYDALLSKLMIKQIKAQQTTDPVIIGDFEKLRKKVSQTKQEIDKIEKERLCFKEVRKKVSSLIFDGGSRRTQEFLELEEYSFLK